MTPTEKEHTHNPQVANELSARARALGLWGLLAHDTELTDAMRPYCLQWIAWEEEERRRRSLARRLQTARLGTFKPMSAFDFSWPKRPIDTAIHECLSLRFIDDAANVVLAGPNGVGKTTLAKNIAYQAIRKGHLVRFVTASEMLVDLAAQEGTSALFRRLKRYVAPRLLVIDELGYLSYGHRHADLLFEVISRRYGEKSILITTNKAFSEWNDVFPNAACVTALIDRLIHRCDIIDIDADSYRLKEAQDRRKQKSPNKRNK